MDSVALKVGATVKMTEAGRDEYGPTPNNPHDLLGTIIEDRGPGYFGLRYRVEWSNNHTNAYAQKDLEEVRLTVGSKVYMSESGKKKYDECVDNPYHIVGVIVEDDEAAMPYLVEWSNGHENWYEASDLDVVVGTEVSTDLLSARGQTHGEFSDNSVFIQGLKDAFRGTPNWDLLTAPQKEALDMMASKMGRALFGQPSFKDHWEDMSGYPKLVAERLP